MIDWRFLTVDDIEWVTKVGKQMFADSEWKEGEYDAKKIKKYLHHVASHPLYMCGLIGLKDDEMYDVRLADKIEDEDARKRMLRAIMMEARLKTPEGDRVLQDTVDTVSQNFMMSGIGSGDEDMFNRRMADVEDRMAQRTDPMLFRAQGGIADLDMRGGGASFGPGTGTSDDVPAMLSDGEFVMTANAVRNLGGGDRMVGAKRMYNMMNQLDPNSQTPGEMNTVGYG